jgi:hypothetical protein
MDFFIKYVAAKRAKKVLPPQDFQAAVALAQSLGLPKTAKSISSDSGLPKDEMWPGTRVPVPSYVAQALVKIADIKLANLKSFFIRFARSKQTVRDVSSATRSVITPMEYKDAYDNAIYLKMPKTANSIMNAAHPAALMTSMPADEAWPSTNISVQAFVNRTIYALGLPVLVQFAGNTTPTPVAQIPGANPPAAWRGTPPPRPQYAPSPPQVPPPIAATPPIYAPPGYPQPQQYPQYAQQQDRFQEYHLGPSASPYAPSPYSADPYAPSPYSADPYAPR